MSRLILRNRWFRRASGLLAAVCLTAALAAGFFYWRHPGFVGDMFREYHSANHFSELIDEYHFMVYYFGHYGLLRDNPETGIYDLTLAAREYDSAAISDFERAQVRHHMGKFSEAIELIRRDIEDNGESEEKLFWLALSYQRVAEERNCGLHSRTESASGYCSLPLTTVHEQVDGSEQAAEIYLRLLDQYDQDNGLYRWLLNFCYMTLGRFPEGVEEKYRADGDFIDLFYGGRKAALEERFSQLSFREAAHELGINLDDAGKGVAVEDFDRDGYLDIITGGTYGKLKYFRNVQGREFVDATESAGLQDVLQPYVISAADYDNDGWFDLFVGRPFHCSQLFRNRGDGTFEDVTFSSGLFSGPPDGGEMVGTVVSTWGDVNNDGFLDLFLAQFGQRVPFVSGLLARRPMGSRLFLNVPGDREGERGFRDVTAAMGIEKRVDDRILISGAFGDYDGDGWTDLFLSSFVGPNSVLMRNVQGRYFEPTEQVQTSGPNFTSAFVDVNHDGRLDLFVGGFGPARSITENAVFGKRSNRYGSAVHVQREDGFEERRELFRDGLAIGTMGSSFGDLNNDGAYDFYLGTGSPEGWYMLPNLMYIGEVEGRRCTGYAANATPLFGFGTIQKGHGIVFFDFDNDGDQDVYSSLGGMWPGDSWPNQMFVNESELERSWTKIRLRGRSSNFYGVGSVIRVDASTADGQPIVRYYHMTNKTGFGSAPYLAHIGLMDAARIDKVTVQWAGSGAKKAYAAELGKLNVLDENG